MLKYPEACKKIAEGFTLEDLKYGKKKYNPQDQRTLKRVLLVENRIFQIYLKTGKYTEASFPYEDLKENFTMTKEEMVKLAKLILRNKWSPALHVSKTREKFASITNGFY